MTQPTQDRSFEDALFEAAEAYVTPDNFQADVRKHFFKAGANWSRTFTQAEERKAHAGTCLNCDAKIELSNAGCMDLLRKERARAAELVEALKVADEALRYLSTYSNELLVVPARTKIRQALDTTKSYSQAAGEL